MFRAKMYMCLISCCAVFQYVASVSNQFSSAIDKCKWTKPSDPYLISLNMYNDLIESHFDEPRAYCERPPPACKHLKEIVAGERSPVLAQFHAHVLTLCNLMRLRTWTKENLHNASEVLHLRQGLLKDVDAVSQDMGKLEAGQQLVYDQIVEDLQQVSQYERVLKDQQDKLQDLTVNVLQLQDIAVGMTTMGSWISYILIGLLLRWAGGIRLVAILLVFGLFWTAEVMVKHSLLLFPVDDIIPKNVQIEVIRLISWLCGVLLLWFANYHQSIDALQHAMQKNLGKIESARDAVRRSL